MINSTSLSRFSARWTIRFAVVLMALSIAVLAAASVARADAPDLLDVVAVGDGSATLTSGSTAASVVPLLSSGVIGSPIALPTAASGSNHAFALSGTASSEGSLSLSADGQYLTLLGYGTAPGTASIKSTTSAAVPRVVARISGTGAVDTTTAISNAFSGDNPRGVTSDDGTHFWLAGAGDNNSPKSGIEYATLGATSATPLVTTPNQSRVAGIFGGNLYMSTSTGTAGLYQVGTGLPTSGTFTPSTIAAPSGSDPYGFVFLKLNPASPGPDTLYVSDGGIRKYSLVSGSWVAKGSVTASGQLAGLAGVASGGTARLYATLLDGSKIVALSDASGAGATITGSFSTVATAPANVTYKGIALAPSGQVRPGPTPTVTPSDSALGAVRGATNPSLGLAVADLDSSVDINSITVTAKSSNAGVVPNSNITISGSGASRQISLQPVGTGVSTITVTAMAPDGKAGTSTFQYGASAAEPDANSHFLSGASDASSAVDVGHGYIIVADDEDNQLRLYKSDTTGPPVRTWDFQSQIGVTAEFDVEACARLADTLYCTGSMGNSSSGASKPSTSTLYSATINGTGGSTDLTFGHSYTHLHDDLIAWDVANGNPLGLSDSAASGPPKTIDGFNVEGLDFSADGSTAYLGFRAPLEPTTNRTRALVVPVTNLPSLSGSAGQAQFGTPMEWNLGGNGVRELRRLADGNFLVIAGSYLSGGPEYIYIWDGNPADQPVLTPTLLPAQLGGSWESLFSLPAAATDGTYFSAIEDDGTYDFYGTGQEAKDLPLSLRKARDYLNVRLQLNPQSVSFTSHPPTPSVAGGSYLLRATGGASGEPIAFSAAPSSAGVCSVSGATVSLSGPGTCTVDADQAAAPGYSPGHAEQSFSVITNATSIALGDYHGCAVRSGGSLVCWGINNHGELGDGTTTTSLVPVNAAPGHSYTAVAAGLRHTCAITTGGGVQCWGENRVRQLGDGSKTNSSSPQAVSGLSSGVVQIAAGDFHTCALTSSGVVKCWGHDLEGQLGVSDKRDHWTPVTVGGLGSGVLAISASGRDTCALTSAHGVRCWGRNDHGQLGDDSHTLSTSPVSVVGLGSGVRAVAAGYNHSCAALIAGGVSCWGAGGSGELGNGAHTGSSVPARTGLPGTQFASVSVGFDHSCAVSTGGALYCWGHDVYSQLGVDGAWSSRTVPTAVHGFESGGVTQVAAADRATCAVTTSQFADCWGDGKYLNLGNGSTAYFKYPTAVTGLGF